jgi:cyclohexanone monooxygenase
MADPERLDAVIVGAGFAGLYMLHRLRGMGLTVRVYEAAEGVGGTWFWNRYPGARVDIESVEYCYSFSPELAEEWTWSERYAPQPELLKYLNYVADRFDLRRDIRLSTRVAAARFNETSLRWTVTLDTGEAVEARYCVMATGCLSMPKAPDLPGLESFEGPVYRTSDWPTEGVDFTGQTVGVIGTGSSGIQSIPVIAEQASRLTVFQRTPNFSIPAHNKPLEPAQLEDYRANRERYRAEARQTAFGFRMADIAEQSAMETPEDERRRRYEECWEIGGFAVGGAFSDLLFDKAANDTAVEFVAGKIREIVKDPVTADKLTPKTYPIASKRICVDTGYYETFNRPHVSLVDLTEEPIEAITAKGVKTSAREYPFDALVLAIGFDAMTGALNAIDIRGRGGVALKDKWADGPRTYLGLMVAGFPNLFTITGPGSPSVLSNMAVSIEQHVDWITDCISYLSARQLGAIEATEEAEAGWVDHVYEVAQLTLYPLANSWYMGANVPGKPRVFLPYIGGVPAYTEKCDEVAAKGYEGFALTPA